MSDKTKKVKPEKRFIVKRSAVVRHGRYFKVIADIQTGVNYILSGDTSRDLLLL